jgi:hypothetical protein
MEATELQHCAVTQKINSARHCIHYISKLETEGKDTHNPAITVTQTTRDILPGLFVSSSSLHNFFWGAS